jgi:KDO2-lipid IV(A) lauroyltransferase
MSLAIGYHDQRQSTAIIKRQRNPYVNDFMRKMRTQFGGNVVEMDQAPREIFRGLRNNEVVAMLADQSAPKEGPYVTFFGRITATHPGPAVFCIRSGAPVVMPFLIRTSPGHYRLELRELDTSCPESLPADEKVKLLTQRHVSLLEEYIRKYPDHWLWQHRRWKHSPVGNE